MKIFNGNIKILAAILMCCFLFLAAGYGLSYHAGMFPDESSHLGYINDVVNSGYPDYSNGVNYLDIKLNHLNHPSLYYLLTGWSIRLLHIENVVLASRILNIAVSMLVILVTFKTVQLFVSSRLAIFCGTGLLLLIPMFNELAVAANNDPLNMLGCVLFLYGICKICIVEDKNNIQYGVICIVIGGILAALTKATGALAIVTIFFGLVIFNPKVVLRKTKEIPGKHWFIIGISIVIIATYYCSTYIHFKSLFPAPQGNPATWYALEDLSAKRMDLLPYIISFIDSNINSLIIPYGHTSFEDSNVRVILLKIMLSLIVLLTVRVIFSKAKNKDVKNDLLISFVVSFVVYLILYFLVLRRMHLNTGYPYAMQARYFFGFLPLFCIMFAKGIELIKERVLKVIVLVYFSVCLFYSYYPAYINLANVSRLESRSFVDQKLYNTHFGELISGRTFDQTFLSPSGNIKSVELALATFARVNNGTLIFQLIDDKQTVLKEIKTPLNKINDFGYAKFILNDMALMKNKEYRIRLKCDDCYADNAITWWAFNNEYENPLFMLNKFGPPKKDVYPNGSAYINGQMVNADFKMRLYF